VSPALPWNWYYVYLLVNKETNSVYIGCTSNLEKRFEEHMEGKVFSTKKMLPVELIYYEAYNSKEYAFKREKSLKSFGNSLAKIKSRIGIDKKGRAG